MLRRIQQFFLSRTDRTGIQFIRYFFSGGAAFVSYMLLLLFLTEFLHWYHMVSLVASYAVSILVNFFISKFFVFKAHEASVSRQFMKFFAVALLGLFLQYFIVDMLTSHFSWYYAAANVFASALIYLVSFTFNKIFTFARPS